MRLALMSAKSGLSLGEIDGSAPAARLQEGRVENGGKRPLDLAPGEETVVSYPLEGRDGDEPRRLFCRAIRIDRPDSTSESGLEEVERVARASALEETKRSEPGASPRRRRAVRS